VICDGKGYSMSLAMSLFDGANAISYTFQMLCPYVVQYID